ncbi:MAG: sigma-54-dependent Fis family transcriptional regulator [Lentisphaeria bacterium]|nr:sigma-54-dependent Fis family transcriptional regulator [Lentisphaeria bacterium]
MTKPEILIADDELHTREALIRYLRVRFSVTAAEDGAEAIAFLQNRDFDLVLTDLRMPGADGMGVLEAALSKAVKPECIVFSAYGSIESAVAAVKAGAYDFVPKPVRFDKLDEVIAGALARRGTGKEEKKEKSLSSSGEIVVGNSPPMQKVAELVRTAAPSRINMLLTGESGTGKEVIARAIHDASGRKGLFVPVHCAALPATLLESELFGYEKGAFTGATERHRGRFELASGGTIFLDEIGEIDPSIQVKLLRVLETRTIERIGGSEEIQCDTRLVSATNRDLAAMVREGTFREDLFYRLEGVTIQMPPLRERKDDIAPLATCFLQQAARENERNVTGIDREAMALLEGYSWPGNIRELRHTIERMVVLAKGEILTAEDVPDNIRNGIPATTRKPEQTTGAGQEAAPAVSGTLNDNERKLIEEALQRCGGNRTRAAQMLGISRRTLHRRLQEYALSSEE